MTTVIASTHSQRSGNTASRTGCTEREISVTFVDAAPDGYDPDVAAAFGSLAADYQDISADLFDGDPDLTSHAAAKNHERL